MKRAILGSSNERRFVVFSSSASWEERGVHTSKTAVYPTLRGRSNSGEGPAHSLISQISGLFSKDCGGSRREGRERGEKKDSQTSDSLVLLMPG